MKFEFDIMPYQALMNIKVSYTKAEIHQNFFYLNRDFIIYKCFTDNIEYNITDNMELVKLKNWEYEVNKYYLPNSFEQIVIEYTGYLTGKTGSCPYVRETISPEFTFIREETYCYPQFYSDENEGTTKHNFLVAHEDLEVLLLVPDDFIAVSNIEEIENCIENGNRKYLYKSHDCFFAIAIAKYTIKTLAFGNFYLFYEINETELENTMGMAYKFMNEHFGKRVIKSDINYVSIPNGFGSFACPATVFIDEITFKSIKSMNHIIHEFIHLGWNVKRDDETQKIRFFDEAFTSYFEMRVMEYLLKDNYRLYEYIASYKRQLDNNYDINIPIIDFGKHGYGDLSYTIGAIFLYKLSEFVGINVFEEATKIFLNKYKNIPADMEIFCSEYIKLCNKPELKQFFSDWIYTANGSKSFIESCK